MDKMDKMDKTQGTMPSAVTVTYDREGTVTALAAQTNRVIDQRRPCRRVRQGCRR